MWTEKMRTDFYLRLTTLWIVRGRLEEDVGIE